MWWRRVRYVLALVALCALATCPAAHRACVAKRHAREAEKLLDALGDRVETIVAETGKVPPLAAGPSPSPSCCDRGGTCEPDDTTWSAPGWRALGFSIDGDYRYTYQYIPDPSGASAIARATGDLDCDGTKTTLELRMVVVGKAGDPFGRMRPAIERGWTHESSSE
jgi:hypothetical protein